MGSQSAGSITEQLDLFLRSWKSADGSNKYISRIDKMIADGQTSVVIDYEDLLSFDTELATALVENPDRILAYFREAAQQVVRTENASYAELIKDQIQVRIAGLIDKLPLRGVSAKYLDRLVAINGMVVRTSEIKPRVIMAAFVCPNEHITYIPQPGSSLKKPDKCSECNESRDFRLDTKHSKFTDFQVIRLQELPEELPPGQLPQSIDAELLGDLVNKARPGDRIVITGIVRAEPESGIGTARQSTFRTRLDGNYIDVRGKELDQIQITPEDEAKIRKIAESPTAYEDLVKSVAPAIYGMEAEKEAALLLVAGAPQRVLPDGTTLRGDINALIVGDPGCLVGDERVVLADGSIVKIEEMGKEHLQSISIKVLIDSKNSGTATVFHKYRNQRIIEVITETGKSIKGTPNHPLLSVSDGAPVWKRLDQLKVGDQVAVITHIPCKIKKLQPTGFGQAIKNAKREVKYPRFYDINLAKFLGFMLSSGKVDPQAGKFVLYANEDELEVVIKLVKKLYNINPSRVENTNAGYRVEYSHSNAACTLKELVSRRVPAGIMRSSNKVVAEFLKYMLRTFSEKSNVVLQDNSIELLRDLQMLLLRFSIKAIIRDDRLELTDEDKKRLLYILSSNKAGSSIKIKKAKGEGIAFEHIIKVSSLEEKMDVYDIEVPGSNRFVANGIISHNTGKSELLKYVARLAPRGLYTSGRGTTAAGLCVGPDSLLITPYGPRTIKELVEDEMKSHSTRINEKVKSSMGRINQLLIPNIKDIITLARERKKVLVSQEILLDSPVYGHTDVYYRIIAERTISLKTSIGKTLVTTPETKVICYSPETGRVYWKEAGRLGKDEWVVMTSYIPEGINLNGLKPWEELDGDELAEIDFQNIPSELVGILKECKGNRIQYNKFKELCKKEGFNIAEAWGAILYLSKKEVQRVERIKAPHDDRLFLHLAAYCLSSSFIKRDGSGAKVYFRRKRIAMKLVRLLKKDFGHEIYLIKEGRFYTIRLGPLMTRLVTMLVDIHGNLKAQNTLFLLPNRKLALFLSDFFECNLAIDEKGIRLKIGNEILAQQIDVILARFGVVSEIKKNREISLWLRDEDSLSFIRNILTYRLRKRLERYYDHIHNEKNLIRLGRFYIASKVVEVKEIDQNLLYDLTIKEGSAFVANSFLVHNTAAVVKEKNGLMMLEAGAVVLADLGVACLHPKAPILFNDRIYTIEEIAAKTVFEPAYSKGEVVEIGSIAGKVYSLDLHQLRVSGYATTLIRRKRFKGKLKRLVFRTGNEILLTPDHMLLDSSLTWRPAGKFTPGEAVVAPSRISCYAGNSYVWDLLPEDSEINLDSKQKESLISEIDRSKANISRSDRELLKKEIRKSSRIKLGELKKIVCKLGVESYWRTEQLTVWNCSIRKCMITPELAYLVGYRLGSNYVSKLNSRQTGTGFDESLLKDKVRDYWTRCFKHIHKEDCLKNFDLHISDEPFNSIYLYFTRDHLANIFTLSDECLKGFFAGVIDSNKSTIDLKDGVSELKIFRCDDIFSCRNLALALRRLGLIAFVRYTCEGSSVIVSSENNDIFILAEKLASLSLIMQRLIEGLTSQSVELLSNAYTPAIQAQQKLSTAAIVGDSARRADYFLDEIIQIEDVDYEGYVYDLYVPEQHNYVAAGIIVENCIDEFDKMRPEDRGVLHEVMEQQSYHPSTEIRFASGKKVRIGDYVDNLFRRYSSHVVKGRNCEILPLEKGEEIYSYDFNWGRIKLARIDRASRHLAPDHFIKISYSNGREVIVTPEHPVYVLRQGVLETVRADQIRAGDWVPAVKIIGDESKKNGLTISPKLARVLGHITSSGRFLGNTLQLNSSNCEAIKDMDSLMHELFGVISDRDGERKSMPRRYTSKSLFKWFRVNFSELTKRNKRVPARLFESSKQSVIEFMDAVFMNNGYNEKGAIVCMADSRGLAEDYQDLLLLVGISSRIEYDASSKIYKLYVEDGFPSHSSDFTAGQFENQNHEGFKELSNAQAYYINRLLETRLQGSTTLAEVTDWFNLQQNSYESLTYVKVKDVSILRNRNKYNTKWVYDLTVEPTHNFISQGVILHNTVSVAKGGIVATLNARTSIVAASNPLLGTYDPFKNIYENVNLPIPLLSRFDIIFIVRDTPDRVADEKLATHILTTHRYKGFVTPPPIDFELLRKYIVYCKKIDPVLTPEAESKLLEFYLQMRSMGGKENMITVTPRQLESLIRLATARARLLLRDKVTEEDALVAISLVRRMLSTVGVDVRTGKIDIGVLSGRASSERNLIELALEVFKDLQGKEKAPVSANSFIEALEKTGKFNREEARKMINMLYKMGQIYEIKPGYYSRIT